MEGVFFFSAGKSSGDGPSAEQISLYIPGTYRKSRGELHAGMANNKKQYRSRQVIPHGEGFAALVVARVNDTFTAYRNSSKCETCHEDRR